MKRDRLSRSPVSEPVTYTPDVNVYENESFILDEVIELHGFRHWVAHLVALELNLRNEPAPYLCGAEFPKLRDVVADALARSGYPGQAKEVESAATENELNRRMVRQYTEETPLYVRRMRSSGWATKVRMWGRTPFVPGYFSSTPQFGHFRNT